MYLPKSLRKAILICKQLGKGYAHNVEIVRHPTSVLVDTRRVGVREAPSGFCTGPGVTASPAGTFRQPIKGTNEPQDILGAWIMPSLLTLFFLRHLLIAGLGFGLGATTVYVLVC